jgi:hypothetical protein
MFVLIAGRTLVARGRSCNGWQGAKITPIVFFKCSEMIHFDEKLQPIVASDPALLSTELRTTVRAG